MRTIYSKMTTWIKWPCSSRVAGTLRIQWGRDIPHPSIPALVPTQPPVQWVAGFYGGKTTGAWRWPPNLLLAPRLGKKVDQYLYSPLSLRSVQGSLYLFLQLPYTYFLHRTELHLSHIIILYMLHSNSTTVPSTNIYFQFISMFTEMTITFSNGIFLL
jgi:hypothetical protein